MGILNSLFNKNSKKNTENKPTSSIPDYISSFSWKELRTLEQLTEIKNNSKSKKQCIFKHSTRCSISSNVLNQFSKQKLQEYQDQYDFYYLDLIQFREVSNEIASLFKVQHASPQAIVLDQEKVVTHNSHEGILEITL